MTFNSVVSISDFIAVAALIVGAISAFAAIIQWRSSVALKRAEYIDTLTEKIRSDKDIWDVVYDLDYGEKWYSPDFHGSGKLERKVDKTLSYFSYIVYLRKAKILTKKEFDFFRYEVERLLYNQNTRDYLYNLYHFSKSEGLPCTFTYLIEYGRRHCPELFDEEFFDCETCDRTSMTHPANNGMVYHKYLNF